MLAAGFRNPQYPEDSCFLLSALRILLIQIFFFRIKSSFPPLTFFFFFDLAVANDRDCEVELEFSLNSPEA